LCAQLSSIFPFYHNGFFIRWHGAIKHLIETFQPHPLLGRLIFGIIDWLAIALHYNPFNLIDFILMALTSAPLQALRDIIDERMRTKREASLSLNSLRILENPRD